MKSWVLFIACVEAQIDFDYTWVDSEDYPDWMLEDEWEDFVDRFDDLSTNEEVAEVWSSTEG